MNSKLHIPQVIKVVIAGEIKKRIKEDIIHFKPGINLIIGENGCGKSSLFKLLTHPSEEEKEVCKVDSIIGTYYLFDFEKDNPRKSSSITTMPQITSRLMSHGESNKAIIQLMAKEESKNCMFFMDEPEQALDIKGIKMLLKIIKSSKALQINIITHHPYLILDPMFNIIELSEGYYNMVLEFQKKFNKTL